MWCCDGNFLLAETKVVMTTLISSHVKNKNNFVSSLDIKFSSLEKSWYFIGLYIMMSFITSHLLEGMYFRFCGETNLGIMGNIAVIAFTDADLDCK